jgi:ArsR family transcriptional regulator
MKGSIASKDLAEVVRALKSAAENTRLRLLALLQHGELTVGELCAILGQSQPRVSRHLRLLTEAGLLERFREQQCVYYRAPADGHRLHWLRALLAFIDPEAPPLKRDRARAAEVIAAREVAAAELAPREELEAVLLEELGAASVGELLDIGTGAGLVLEILGPRARRAIGVDISAPALRLARTRLHSSGLSHVELRRGDMYHLPYDDESFDTVTMDRVLAGSHRPVVALTEAARTLRSNGRLIVVEDFEQIGAHAADNPIAELRRWLSGAGLIAQRLHPCDLLDRHFIVALAQRVPVTRSELTDAAA